MARQTITYIFILLVGLAGGIGIGFLMSQQKIDTANKTIDELETQQAQTEADIQAAVKKMSRMEAELTKARNSAMRKNTELLRAQTELMRLKNRTGQRPAGQQETTVASQTPATATTTRTASSTATTAGAKEYTIKDGDSLWKIAASELDNGIRYKEILELNPEMTENTTLVPGVKIKIPAD